MNEELEYYLQREADECTIFAGPMGLAANWKTQIDEVIYRSCVDWFFSEADRLHLQLCTVNVIVTIFNRFLFSESVAPKQLHLVAAATMMIAIKTEEIFTRVPLGLICPELNRKEMCAMERLILASLNFCIPRPVFIYFIDHYHGNRTGDLIDKRVMYLTQHVLTSRNYLLFLPSVLARSIVDIAHDKVGEHSECVFNLCHFNPSPFLQSKFSEILHDNTEFAKRLAT